MTKEVKFTPGPWDASGLTVYDTCMDSVASTHNAADAHLIAAAPELLEALEAALDYMTAHWDEYDDCGKVSLAQSAIAKALGHD